MLQEILKAFKYHIFYIKFVVKPSSPGNLSFDISFKADDSSMTVNKESKNLFCSSLTLVYHLFQEIRLSEFYFLLCIYLFYKVFQKRRLALPKYFLVYLSQIRINHRFHVFIVITLFL